VNGAPAGAYIQYTWDQRNQLTKIEFYNAPVNGVWPLNKTVSYSYDGSSNRISKTLAVPGQTSVVENYVYDGDQLVAVMDGTGVIQHEYFNGNSMDQVFADQTALSSVLWPLEDRTGAARDIISTAGVVLDHRTLDSFGNISSRSGSSIDYDQFFSGLFYDADSQLYYARARWYDATSGRFLGEDPLRFGAGDTNLTRYSANDPVNLTDPSGKSWLSHAFFQAGGSRL
jgi:RHS repeat-associated protein